jgi:hypothetical protein
MSDGRVLIAMWKFVKIIVILMVFVIMELVFAIKVWFYFNDIKVGQVIYVIWKFVLSIVQTEEFVKMVSANAIRDILV